MNRLFATTALVTALAMTPALAQQYGEQPKGDDQLLQQQEQQKEGAPQDQMLEQRPQDQAPQDQAAEQQPMETQQVQFVASQERSDWLASSLIGRTVYNLQDENLGEINDVIVGEDGRVIAILIGVGGFLGIGEKDVGVNFAALQFMPQAEAEAGQPGEKQETSALDQPPATGEEAPAGQSEESFTLRDQSGEVQGEAQIEVEKDQQAAGEQPQDRDQQMTETQPPAATGQAPMAESDQRLASGEVDADHSEMIIVLNTTKEELEAAPAFAYLEDQGTPAGQQ